jgi:hypothetical protein
VRGGDGSVPTSRTARGWPHRDRAGTGLRRQDAEGGSRDRPGLEVVWSMTTTGPGSAADDCVPWCTGRRPRVGTVVSTEGRWRRTPRHGHVSGLPMSARDLRASKRARARVVVADEQPGGTSIVEHLGQLLGH